VVLALLLPILPDRTPTGSHDAGRLQLTGSASAREKQLQRRLQSALENDELPRNLTPGLKDAARDLPPVYFNGCHRELDGVTAPKSCESFGDAGGKKQVVLFGDSHAAQWWSAMDRIAENRHWRLASFTKSACSAADVTIYLDLVKRNYTECVQWRENMLDRIRQMKPDLVVMSSNVDGGEALNGQGSQDERWVAGWRRTARAIRSSGAKLVYLDDSAWPAHNVPECLSTRPTEISACAADRREAVTAPDRREMIKDMIRDLGGAVVDPLPWFCVADGCPVVVGNVLVYQDDSHITQAYTRTLAPILGERLKLG